MAVQCWNHKQSFNGHCRTILIDVLCSQYFNIKPTSLSHHAATRRRRLDLFQQVGGASHIVTAIKYIWLNTIHFYASTHWWLCWRQYIFMLFVCECFNVGVHPLVFTFSTISYKSMDEISPSFGWWCTIVEGRDVALVLMPRSRGCLEVQ